MLRLGIIGLSPGNGHPYSWSAIINGYDKEKMAKCPFPAIPQYLGKVDPATMGIEGARVTHIWTQDRAVSEDVAGASLIDHVVDDAAKLTGAVDAVLLARDDGENHLRMAKPFIEAGIPILIDKPLTDNPEDLRRFVKYYEAGKPIMSCSSVRYSAALRRAKEQTGRVHTAHAIIGKYWRTYGIHIIEGVFAVMGGGVEAVRNVGREGEEIVHLQFADGRHAVLQTFKNIKYVNHLSFYGESGHAIVTESDPYSSFKAMLADFVKMLKTGKPVLDWRQTVETAKIVSAAALSLREGSRVVRLSEIV